MLRVGEEYSCTAPLNEVSFRALYVGRDEKVEREIFYTDDNRYVVIDPSNLTLRGGRLFMNDLLDVRPGVNFLKKSSRELVEAFE